MIMTKKNVWIAVLLMAVVGIFASCVEDPVSEEAPTITVSSPTADSIDIFIGDSIDFTIALSSENGLTKFKAMTTSEIGIEITNSDLTFDGTNNESVTVKVKVTESASEGNVNLTFVVEDGQKSANAIKTLVISKKETPLSEATGFEWERVAGAAATGLEKFGLTWTDNTSASAVIKKGADKFVELSADAWTNITSLEALTAAVDAAEDMERWEKISVQASDSYDLTLGTKVENSYFLIHITNATVTADQTIGTTITIVGEYKE